jgi:hypothetical protein
VSAVTRLTEIARDLTPPLLWRAVRQLRDRARERAELKAAAAYEITVGKKLSSLP